MPRKPSKDVINAAKVNLDPRATLEAILNEPQCAEIRQALIDAGLVKEVPDSDNDQEDN